MSEAERELASEAEREIGSQTDREPDIGTQRLRADYEANVDNRLQAAVLGVLALAAALSPLLLDWLLATAGTRTMAVGIALAGAAAAFRAHDSRHRLVPVFAVALAVFAAISGATVTLLLLPALIYATLAVMFLATVRDDISMVERVAKTIQPAAPDFIAPYCRRVTVLWGFVFMANAAAVAAAALLGSQETWRQVAGIRVWGWMAAITAAEFFVRKTYFRNYWYGGPFEQLWSRLFPADATPMGRRSAEHIRQTREKLGLK